MFKWANQFLDRLESRVALWSWIVVSGALSVMTGFLSRAAEWVQSFGDFAWIIVALVTLLICLLIGLVFQEMRYKYNRSYAIKKWSIETDGINPLDDNFVKKRISLSELADPLSRTISNKVFHNCELFGPCNIYLGGDCSFGDVTFDQVDLIELGNNNVRIMNGISLERCTFKGGRIALVTILATNKGGIAALRKLGAIPLTDNIRGETLAKLEKSPEGQD